jgi:putative restriction endonuclease
VKAFVAVTDNDWLRFLSTRPDIEEVNFWTPSGRSLMNFTPGAPVLFKLHAPFNDIVGGGFFATFSVLPASIAWDAFGEKNGAATLSEMRRRIEHYRRVDSDPRDDYNVGCTILVEPFFFDREDWIPAPEDFSQNIVRGKSYDLTTGIGRALWERVMGARSATRRVVAEPGVERIYGDLTLIKPRLGQGAFRVLVTDTYERRCAVTGERALPVLQAAHIRPVSEGGTHSLYNGLLLRADLHALYDRGYVTVTPRFEFHASRRLRDEFDNGEYYLAMSGTRVWVPEEESRRPAGELLEWHADTVFKG